MTDARVQVRDLRKEFRARGEGVVALDGVSLDVRVGEMVVLLGPSGCGKTTLLRSIAGLEEPDSGSVVIDGRTVFADAPKRIDLPPERRGISFVFQSYALWPHLTVLQNVAYPLRASGVGPRDAARRATETLDLLGCDGLGRRYPGELSGGQQQRVALARAIVARSSLVFFDEPLSNIDAKDREKLRLELLNIRDAVGFGGLYVTHDQEEAMVLGDRVAVMNRGSIAQVATPRDVYERPATRWVADFIGTANFVDAVVGAAAGDRVKVVTATGGMVAVAPRADLTAGDRTSLFFRPEWATLTTDEPEAGWPVRVVHSIFAGARTDVIVECGESRLVIDSTTPLDPGDAAWLAVDESRALAFGVSA